MQLRLNWGNMHDLLVQLNSGYSQWTLDAHFLVEALCQNFIRPQHFKTHLHEFILESYGIKSSCLIPDLHCFVNAQSNTYGYQGHSEVNNIAGSIQLCPVRSKKAGDGSRKIIVKRPDCKHLNFKECRNLYDSGAFPEVVADARVTPEVSLQRQLDTLAQLPEFKETLLVSYDRLIDEKHHQGNRIKQRWSVEEGELAVAQTVEAAAYLNSQRSRLQNYTLVQSCQGVDAQQYLRCVEQVLSYCQKGDVLGLGGWCILGRQPSYLQTFWETINLVIPLVASSGITKIHIFGCTWYKPKKYHPLPPLPPLLWLCDRHHISLSTDGRSPIGNALWKDGWQSAGAIFPYWRHNLAWVKSELATLRDSPQYQPPPGYIEAPQLFLMPKFLEKASEQAGCLYQYLESKKLKDGSTIEYPKVLGERDPNNPEHWRWGFNWKEKRGGKWKGRSIGSIPHSAIAKIRTMQQQGAKREEVVSFILEKKAEGRRQKAEGPNSLPSNSPTAVILFAGGGGIEAGMVEAGIRPVVAVEYDPTKPKLSGAIAKVHSTNFPQCQVIQKTVREVAASKFVDLPEYCDYLHSSTVCSNFSNANTTRAKFIKSGIIKEKESSDDIDSAHATSDGIQHLKPQVFTLEQVPGYLNSQSFQIILETLNDSGYTTNYKIIKLKNYGLPQSRERLFLIAGKGFYIPFPPEQEKIMGWYEAIAHLIPAMPDSKLLNKQQQVVDQFLKANPPMPLLIQRAGIRSSAQFKPGHLPCNTILRSHFTDNKGCNRTKFADIWLPNGMVKSLTIEAAAILQGFPSWYKFPTEVATAGSIIGYSVPPSFAKQLFAHCQKVLISKLQVA